MTDHRSRGFRGLLERAFDALDRLPWRFGSTVIVNPEPRAPDAAPPEDVELPHSFVPDEMQRDALARERRRRLERKLQE